VTDDDLAAAAAGPLDTARFRQVLGHFCTGVTIIAALDAEGMPTGFTAQSFTSLSLDPPLVSFSPSTTSSTWPKIEAAGHFCVSILAEDQEVLCRTFAESGIDKFKGVGWWPAPATGSPVMLDALAWVDCRITEVHPAGDHLIVVGQVLSLKLQREGKPLLFYRGGFGRFEA
jgi:flavin reductase (DIM6/NTAB) family NADH-FMN oxidoreductase RutF